MKKIILPFLSLVFLAACNNSSENPEDKKDSSGTSVSHDNMNHGGGGNMAVPELPAVPEGAKVFFKNLKEGAIISSPFKVEMGVNVIKIDTAGPVVAGYGHHHLFINAEDSLVAGKMVPTDSSHIHFGKGQTEYELKLTPGKYKLTLQFADGLHRSYGEKLSSTVNVVVK